MYEIHKHLDDAIKTIEKTRAAYVKEREARMDAEQAATFCFVALCEANNEADVRRAYKIAEDKWPWIG